MSEEMQEMNGIQFDLNNLNPGEWFVYPDNENTKICLRVCAGDDLREITKQTTKKKIEWKVNPTTRRVERAVYDDDLDPDGSLFNELLWDFCIVDWEGILDSNKNKIPCTRENKKLLMGKSVKFAQWVVSCLDILRESNKEKEEEEIKNL